MNLGLRAIWLLRALGAAALAACGAPDAPDPHDTAGDTAEPPIAARALGGQAPGQVRTAREPLSTIPLEDPLWVSPTWPATPAHLPFAIAAHLDDDEHPWRLDVGVRAGPHAATAADIGLTVAFNPHRITHYALLDARGVGEGIEPERIAALSPGQGAGGTYLLWPTAPREAGAFLGTLLLTWTGPEGPEQQLLVLRDPAPTPR